jgi:hypothetical protein
MIIILFPAGAFGSTIEYSLRQFTKDFKKISFTAPTSVLDDGSVHSYTKECHPTRIEELSSDEFKNCEIATVTYPGKDFLSPVDTIMEIKKNIDPLQKVVLIYFDRIELAERNQLFSYNKIPKFLDIIMKNKHTAWNSTYQSYKDMQPFELQEALSLYIDQMLDYLKVSEVINDNWLCVTPDDILYNFENTLLKIIEYFDLTLDTTQSIQEFYNIWFAKQQYIVDEFEKINEITNSFNFVQPIDWDNLSILGRAIVQSRLRKQGIEITCDDTFNVFSKK